MVGSLLENCTWNLDFLSRGFELELGSTENCEMRVSLIRPRPIPYEMKSSRRFVPTKCRHIKLIRKSPARPAAELTLSPNCEARNTKTPIVVGVFRDQFIAWNSAVSLTSPYESVLKFATCYAYWTTYTSIVCTFEIWFEGASGFTLL